MMKRILYIAFAILICGTGCTDDSEGNLSDNEIKWNCNYMVRNLTEENVTVMSYLADSRIAILLKPAGEYAYDTFDGRCDDRGKVPIFNADSIDVIFEKNLVLRLYAKSQFGGFLLYEEISGLPVKKGEFVIDNKMKSVATISSIQQ